MFTAEEYELLDFGAGEKLERFRGSIKIRRPSPGSACLDPEHTDLWDDAVAYDRESSLWTSGDDVEGWVEHRGFKFRLQPTPTGQVGLFPEQAKNWDWILDHPQELSGLKALNLFGYTGGTTMALAKREVAVTHVDAAKSVVNWARGNAKESGLGEAPIRWIVEDAVRFLEREIKRGNEYQIIVADPPSFGRGPKNETWKIQRDLEKLVEQLITVTHGNCKMLILSCHTPDYTHGRLKELLAANLDLSVGTHQSFRMSIPIGMKGNEGSKRNSRRMYSGCCVRFSSSRPSSNSGTLNRET